MARRRRFRRNRRRTYNNYKDQQEHQNNEAPINNSITTTPVTRNVRSVLTPIQNLDTPRILRSNSLVLRKNMNSEVAARSRSNSFVTPKNQNVYNNINCTNLNSLFEEKARMKTTSNLLLEEQRCLGAKFRSISSVPKFPSQQPSPVMVDVGTQTAYYNNSVDKNCLVENKLSKVMNETKYNIHTFAQIFETPKIPHNLSSEYTVFAPQYQASSTPVDICNKENNLLTDIAKNFIHNKRLAMKNSFYFDCTPNPKLTSAILDKNKLYSVNKHRFYKSMSPKVYRNTFIKLCNKQRNPCGKNAQNNNVNYTIPKSFSPMKKSALQKSDNFLNVGSVNMYTKVMARVRSFHRKHSSKWVGKFLEVCAWFGLTIRTGLVAMYKPKTNICKESQSPQEAICACKDMYEAKIGELEDKMKDLRASCDKEVEAVKSEMVKLRSELVDLMDSKIAEIKGNIKNTPSTISICGDSNIPRPPPPPPMLPPPPPLPPPLPLNMITPISRIAKLPKANRESKKENEEARPVISLDDILKVKLRKAGDRQQTPKLQRRNTQPVVSMDMLKQVKLRPATRAQAASFTDISNSTLSTSPASSLTRILSKVDSNVHRVKRLKRIGGYSSDDICRKMHGFKREFGAV